MSKGGESSMPFYQRGVLYLTRKRAKSILLLMIFLFVNSMILGTNMILHAAEHGSRHEGKDEGESGL